MNNFKPYPKYKDSGVQWLGEIPEGWRLLANKHIFKLRKTQVGKRSSEYDLLSLTLNGVIKRDMENPEGKFPAEFDTYQEVTAGDFIFCLFDVEETPRAIGLSPHDGMITGAYTVMRPYDDFSKQFLYYFYLNIDSDKRLKPLYRGLRNTIPKESFASFKAFIPPKSEQIAIANFLDEKVGKIDAAIAQKERLIELLNERKQIIIQNAVTKGLNPKAPMRDSGIEWIGKIPEHWTLSRVKFCSKYISKGTTPSTIGREVLSEGEIRFIKSENIVDGAVTESPCEFIDRKTNSMIARSVLETDDVLFVIAGASLGKTAVLPEELEGSNTNQAVCFIRPNGNAESHYLEMWLQSAAIRSQIWVDAVQSAQPNLSMESLGNFLIPLPPNREQCDVLNYINRISKSFTKSAAAAAESVQKLKEYKATLINSAVTGKIDVSSYKGSDR